MSGLESALLSQCMEMTKELIMAKQKVSINIRVGSEFCFEFCNMEKQSLDVKKKLTPSQMKRNLLTRHKFDQKKTDDTKGDLLSEI